MAKYKISLVVSDDYDLIGDKFTLEVQLADLLNKAVFPALGVTLEPMTLEVTNKRGR